MKRFYPEKYKKMIEGYASCLPFMTVNPFHPFTSCTVNVNARSGPHKDLNDAFKSCNTANFGFFSGGELVLWECGLIIRTGVLELITFYSALILHANLDYDGFRGSLVLHTEKEGENKYAQRDNNGWSNVISK